jgi:hypothetical protein
MYDVIIVGAGISGLYMAYRLSEKNPNLLLIDKNNYVGGRILTIKDTHKNKSIQYEAGAARIAHIHTNFLDLIEELGFKKDLIEIKNEKVPIVGNLTYKTRHQLKKVYTTSEKLEIPFLIEKILTKAKYFTQTSLRNMSMYNLAQHVLSFPAADFLLDAFGYESELLHLNAYDGVRMFKKDFNSNNKFFILKSGLSKVCESIYQILEKRGVTIKLGVQFQDYVYSVKKKMFTVKIQDLRKINTYHSSKLVMAIPKTPLMKIPKLKCLSTQLNSVIGHDLNRIYAIYPKNKEGKVWFHDIPKITTDNPLQFIIPYNTDMGLIMISYSDDYFAQYWKQSMMNDTLEKDLERHLKQLFPHQKIPKPSYLKMHFWKDGAHFYRPGYNSERIYKKINHPFPNRELYIIGECYSLQQAWIEGAIVSANQALHTISKNRSINPKKKILKSSKLLSALDSLPTYSLAEVRNHNKKNDAWIIIDDLVLDVTDWLPSHPGGKIIHNGIGKDATKMWYKIPSHNVDIALRYFPQFLIGRYIKKTHI